jgi:hypothetical protein
MEVHHIITRDNGERYHLQFLHVVFDETEEILAASDHKDNVFIIDLASKR